MGRILIVDDEPHTRRVLAVNLRQDNHEASECGSVAEARREFQAHDFDAVLTDQKLPDGDGLQVLAHAIDADPTISVVVLTAFATIELAVESMRLGAFDFLTKPFQPDVVRATLRRACERTMLVRQNSLLKNAVGRLEGSSAIVGVSHEILRVRELIARVAPTNATVLITGETGTGKELVARAIHKDSPRSALPFVAVNCAAFTETLLESELFGHEKGAFTGADRNRAGLFEAAHGGTLFLDEVAEMSAAAQAKLLRVVTDGQVLRIGTTSPRKVDVRLLVATHRDLQQRVREGLFREDLYYRLAVVPIAISPLRERREDISLLCDLFLHQVALELKLPQRALSAEALEKLNGYEFPGNVRELRNLIERASILSTGGELGAESFPVSTTGVQESRTEAAMGRAFVSFPAALPKSEDLRSFLAGVEREFILRTLKATGGAQAEAARRLGISRSDLGYKVSKYGISITDLNPGTEAAEISDRHTAFPPNGSSS